MVCRNTRQKDAIIAYVKGEQWKSSSEIAAQLDYPMRGSMKYFLTINCINTTAAGAHSCFLTILLYGCNSANVYTPSLCQ
jgi:hypothetical protein